VTAIGLRVGDEVLVRKDVGQFRNFVPHGLCLLEAWTPFDRALRAARVAFRSAAAACPAVAAGMKECFFRPKTATAGDVLEAVLPPVNPPPRSCRTLLVRNPFGAGEISRAIRAENTARGHDWGMAPVPDNKQTMCRMGKKAWRPVTAGSGFVRRVGAKRHEVACAPSRLFPRVRANRFNGEPSSQGSGKEQLPWRASLSSRRL